MLIGGPSKLDASHLPDCRPQRLSGPSTAFTGDKYF